VNECQSLSIETRLNNEDTISEDEAKRWVRQVTEAMDYSHSIGVSHNNLRSENVIFDKENDIKVVGLDMTSIYWDSDMEQVITKKKIWVKDKKQLEKVNHMPLELYLYLKVHVC
jgi:serine/threonine protein kinase